jgi:hypothetical protein
MSETIKRPLIDEYDEMAYQWYDAHNIRLAKLKKINLISNIILGIAIYICGYFLLIVGINYFAIVIALLLYILIWSNLRNGQKEILLEIESARQQDDLKHWFLAAGGANDYRKLIEVPKVNKE